ncbi:FUSC family membrane protein [Pontibacter vulgaris]|uniref:FUSC family membrane protein n=1 Tax=Pontibacter vulgaris TaxID=2905679 RepID=UPI001FA7D4A9|nr:FUSC family membrane protein [Pontibacter vulgaris]
MNKKTLQIQYFLFSQYFSDGLRITLGVLLPSLLFALNNKFEVGLTLSLGALCVSIVDTPGPVVHKRNAMLISSFLIFVSAMITGFARMNTYVLGLEVLLFSFFFSMFVVYGNRAAGVGVAPLLVMILMMDNNLTPAQVPFYSCLVLAGGLWYTVLSLLFFQMLPYRAVQQSLGECIHEVAKFLRLRSAFYNPATDIEEDYHQLVTQQVLVNEKQDAVREVLFKSRLLIKESTHTSRLLMLSFVDVVDLYEQITTTHYDYTSLRNKFGRTGILENIEHLIQLIADELDNIGFAIQSNTTYKKHSDLNAYLEQLKYRIDVIGETEKEVSNLPLKKILINLRNLVNRLNDLHSYSSQRYTAKENNRELEYSRFISRQDYSFKIFRDNLTFSSSIFKYSFRVALVCLIGFIVTKTLAYGHHSYWVLLTIIVILKPGFSLTKQRNYERMIGTLAGGLAGVLILFLVKDKTALFVLLLFFMVGTYSFQRINYVISVIFMTPFVLILFKFLGGGELDIVQERIVDTLIGCGIAFAASYFIFPSWESEQLQRNMAGVLRANINYLQILAENLVGKPVQTLDYKLARKEVYVSSANLSASFQRMTSEPKRKQRKSKEVHRFVVLNHILSSYTATLASAILHKERHVYPQEDVRLVKRALAVLSESLKKLEPAQPEAVAEPLITETEKLVNRATTAEDLLLKEQLEFIQKVSTDIRKTTDAILA